LLFGLVGVVLGTTAIGLALMRSGLLPGATGVWGMAPGASTPMILMADENGADARLVAIMHKVRTTIVVALAAIVASLYAPSAVAVGVVPCKVRTTQPPEMVAAVKRSEQPRTESCVVGR